MVLGIYCKQSRSGGLPITCACALISPMASSGVLRAGEVSPREVSSALPEVLGDEPPAPQKAS